MQFFVNLLLALVWDILVQPRRSQKLRQVHEKCLHKRTLH